MISRRSFVVLSAGASVCGPAAFVVGQNADKGPALDPELVQSVVGASHSDFEKVQALVDETPSLVRAAWDWGGGDFETALGAAAHTGRVQIAEFLISRGAPMDLFAAAMLGKLDVVKAVLTAMPEQLHTLGPHKIPLIQHARFEQCGDVREYLEGLLADV